MFKILPLNIALFIYFAALLAMAMALPPETTNRMFSEDGVFETGSVLLWIGMSVALAYTRTYWDIKIWLSLTSLSLFAAMRELDFQKAFTTEGFMKVNYYYNPGIPFVEKMIAGSVFAVILIIAIYSVCRAVRFIRKGGFRTLRGVLLLEIVPLLVITKICDRLPGILKSDFDYSMSDQLSAITLVIEEGGEMIIPVLCIIAIISKKRELVITRQS
ncbi:MAG: hypothetical protein WAX67_07540 [Rugosibacter sp.]